MLIYKISNDQASETIRLIQQYLIQGGTGFDDEKLHAVLEALQHADQIDVGDDGDE